MLKIKSTVRAFLFFLIVFPVAVEAQLTLTPGLSAYQLASMLAGPGVQIINPVITSPSNYYSSFTANGTNLGLASGILLTTGDYSIATGPNNQNGAATIDNNPGDPTLQAIAGVNTYDAAVLEFDFIPQNDTIRFRYIFASEEYPEYVCSTYNDLFGFFISGPGIIGVQNIAIIPGTNIPVAINAVNSGTPGSNSNPNSPCNLSYPNFYVDNTGGTSIQYDGFTTLLTAIALVTPCQVYHLKIVITDAGDADYDSGVFLEAGGLSSTPIAYGGSDGLFCSGTVHQLGMLPVSGWNYSWSPSTGIDNPLTSNPNVTLVNNSGIPITTTYVLSATNGTCNLTDTINLTTYPTPTAAITPLTKVCSADTITIQYTGNANASATYNWNFGGGTVISGSGQGPYQISYPAAGNYTNSLLVKYLACPGDTAYDTLTVVNKPLASIVVPDTICPGETAQIINTGSINNAFTYSWNWNSGNVITGSTYGPYNVSWNTPGKHLVTLNVSNQVCSSTTTDSIFVRTNPIASFTSPNTLCSLDTTQIQFNGSATNSATYSWNFGNANLIAGSGPGPLFISPQIGGKDTIRLVVNDLGCRDTIENIINVTQQPTANFTAVPQICSGDSITLNFTGNTGGALSVKWFLSTGSPNFVVGTGPITSAFNTVGVHPITLEINNAGCIDVKTDSITVKHTPIADFTLVQSICSNDTTQIVFTGNAGITSTYNWQFNKSKLISGSGIGPLNIMPNSIGIDTILLYINESGCYDSIYKTIEIIEQPIALLSAPSQICAGDSATILFVGNSASSSSLNWNVSGGSPVTSASLSQITTLLTTPGNHVVSISINNSGCRDSLSDTILVNPLPLADFSANDVCDGVPVTIQNNSSISNGSINSNNWNFGDSQLSTLVQPGSHTYSSSGDYTIVLTTLSDKLCKDTFALNLTIHDNPISQYSIDSVCAGVASTFIDSTTIASGTIDHRYFFYNNSIIGIDSVIDYTFNGYGSYPTMLVTESDFGCRDTAYKTAIVHSLPSIDITGLPRNGCQPLDVLFDNNSTNIDGPINSITWNFGDDDSSNIDQPLHTYLSSGLFDVSMTAISSYGCVNDSTYADYIEVYPKPIADFIHDPAPADMLSPVVYFTNQTTLADNYLWDLGDSTFTNESDPVHQYNAAGTYTVELIATNDDGCKDTVLGEVIINPSFTLYVPNAFSPNNDGKNDVFLCQGTGISQFKMKIFSRWGNHVCTLYNIDEPWNGTDDGKIAQEETYVYLIEVTDVLKQIHTVTGRVSIIK